MKNYHNTQKPLAQRPATLDHRLFFVSPNHGHGVKSQLIVSLFIIAALVPITSSAAEWFLKPLVKAKAEYDDNPRLLRNKPDDSVTGGILAIEMDLGVKTAVNEFSLKPRLRSARYDNDDSLDTNDVFVDMLGSHSTKRGLWELKAGYARDTTLTSELEDTGLVQGARRRNRWDTDLSWRYVLTQRTNAKFGVEYTDVSYESAVELVDYNNAAVYTTLTYDYTASDQLSLDLRAAQFDPDIDSDTDSYAAILGLQHDFSPVLQGSFQAGIRHSERDFEDEDGLSQDTSDTGAIMDASLTGETPLTTWKVSLSRLPRANGRGFLLERDQLMLSVEHDISPRFSGRLNGRVLDAESLDDSSNLADREYARVGLGLKWQFSRHWYLDGRYRHIWQKLGDSSNKAEANSVLISLAYEGDRRSLSR